MNETEIGEYAVTITGIGICTVIALQPGTVDTAPAQATQSFTIAQATPAITWNSPAPITYGTPLGEAQFNATVGVRAGLCTAPPLGRSSLRARINST